MRIARALAALALPAAVVVPVNAQSPTAVETRGGAVGVEARQIEIGEDAAATTIRQVSVPVGVTWSRGRFAADLGSAWVSSRLSRGDGTARTVSGVGDTQVRLSYTFGRDLVVASIVANLPTGLSERSSQDAPVLGAISSSFFGFPIASHGSGLSTTGGLAVAVPAGEWNIGLAGSVRWSGEFTPYRDGNAQLSYQPGIEGRVRAGADRLIGQARFTAGVTLSTFGTDQFGNGTSSIGVYTPGTRVTAQAGVVAPAGSGSLSVFAWHYFRTEGDSAETVVGNRERITGAGVSWGRSVTPGVDFELGLDGKLAKLGESPGNLIGLELGLGVALGPRFTLLPAVRYDLGNLEPLGQDVRVRGWGASVFVRGR